MTISAKSPLNLDLIGEIFTAIATGREPLVPERFASAYPDEDVTAYVAAFLDPKLVVLMEDALPKPPFPAVKPAVRELAEKIRDSGGWKLVVGRYGVDKILARIAVREAAKHAGELTELVDSLIQQLLTVL
jgi:hypothetical protein